MRRKLPKFFIAIDIGLLVIVTVCIWILVITIKDMRTEPEPVKLELIIQPIPEPTEERSETDKMSEFTETEPEPIVNAPYDESDLEMLAHLIGGEAGANYCSDKMKYYVGSVVLNRVASDYYPDTLEEVIFQKGQYACTWDGNYDREPTESCYEIAKDLLINGSVLPANVIFQAEFEQGDGVYCQEQNMIFCYKGGEPE